MGGLSILVSSRHLVTFRTNSHVSFFISSFHDHGTCNVYSPLCMFRLCFSWLEIWLLYIATNVILRRSYAFACPRSFHFLFKAVYKENQEHRIRCAGIHHCPQLLVVQRSCLRYPRTYRRTQGFTVEEGMWRDFTWSELFFSYIVFLVVEYI